MDPIDFINALKRISTKLNNSVKPSKSLLIQDLRTILSGVHPEETKVKYDAWGEPITTLKTRDVEGFEVKTPPVLKGFTPRERAVLTPGRDKPLPSLKFDEKTTETLKALLKAGVVKKTSDVKKCINCNQEVDGDECPTKECIEAGAGLRTLTTYAVDDLLDFNEYLIKNNRKTFTPQEIDILQAYYRQPKDKYYKQPGEKGTSVLVRLDKEIIKDSLEKAGFKMTGAPTVVEAEYEVPDELIRYLKGQDMDYCTPALFNKLFNRMIQNFPRNYGVSEPGFLKDFVNGDRDKKREILVNYLKSQGIAMGQKVDVSKPLNVTKIIEDAGKIVKDTGEVNVYESILDELKKSYDIEFESVDDLTMFMAVNDLTTTPSAKTVAEEYDAQTLKDFKMEVVDLNNFIGADLIGSVGGDPLKKELGELFTNPTNEIYEKKQGFLGLLKPKQLVRYEEMFKMKLDS